MRNSTKYSVLQHVDLDELGIHVAKSRTNRQDIIMLEQLLGVVLVPTDDTLSR